MPDNEDNIIIVGDFVKFRIQDGENSERVWGEVMELDVAKQYLRVRIDNHPVSKLYRINEELNFPCSFVLGKWKEKKEA